jgi:hypothetical protein
MESLAIFLPEKETNMNLTTWMKTTFADARSSTVVAVDLRGIAVRRKRQAVMTPQIWRKTFIN